MKLTRPAVLAIAILAAITAVVLIPRQPVEAVTILLTNSTDTIGTFRTNVNTSLTNLNSGIGSGGGALSTSSAISAFYFPYWSAPSGTLPGTSTLFFSSTTGNIGIGTVSPTATLEVAGRVSSTELVSPSSTVTRLSFMNATGTGNLQVATFVTTGVASLQGTTFTNATGTGNLQAATLNITGATALQGTTFTNATGTGNLQANSVTVTGNVTSSRASYTLVGSCNASTSALQTDSAGAVQCGTVFPRKSAYFVIENPTASEDDAFYIFDVTSTIRSVYAVNKTAGDTATINLVHAGSRSQATSSAKQVFAAYTAITATSTPACYASPTTTLCSTGTFGTNASTTVSAGSVLRFITSAASSSQFTLTFYYTENQ